MSEADLLAQREDALRRAWKVLQVVRNLVEMSSGKPLPRPAEKSIDEEGQIVCAALARELAGLHSDLNHTVRVAQEAWGFRHDGPKYTTTMRDVIRSVEKPRLGNMQIFYLERAGKDMETSQPERFTNAKKYGESEGEGKIPPDFS